jgi:high-affinity iron transporter
MIESLVIALREGIEAALIVGIILGYLKRVGAASLSRPVYAGILLGVLASIAAAGLLVALRVEFEGRYEQVFEGSTMLLAAAILTSMILWMRNNSRAYSDDLKRKVENAVTSRQSYGLAVLAFVSIFREGIETVLFLGSASFTTTGVQVLVGGSLGLLASVVVGYAILRYSVKLNLKMFFTVTGVLLIFFAAGLVSRAVGEFGEAGLLSPIIEHVWNTGGIVGGESTLGRILGALFGYDASPSLAQLLAYAVYWAVVVAWMFRDTVASLISRNPASA